jgi:hypothetical protein
MPRDAPPFLWRALGTFHQTPGFDAAGFIAAEGLHFQENSMRRFALLATIVAVLAVAPTMSNAAPIAPVEASSPVVQVQQKNEPSTTEKVKRNVKRTWKNLTGYKFNVSCLLSQTRTCTETGNSKAAAQAKCQSQYPLCVVSEAK